MVFRESRCHEVVQFDAEPATVAKACIEVLKSLGKVSVVSRETGTIAGKLTRPRGVTITIRVSRSGNTTEVSVNTERKEGLATSGGAQQGLAVFFEELGKHPELAGSSTAGW